MSKQPQLLPIWSVRGGVSRLVVSCPQRGVVALEECVDCARVEGVVVGAGPSGVAIRCHAHDTNEARGGAAASTPISDIMTKNVVTVSSDTSIDALLWVLLSKGFGGVPVVDDEVLVGIVTSSDLLRSQLRDEGEALPWGDPELDVVGLPLDARDFSVHTLAGLTAADVMTPVVLALPPGAPIAMAAALMSLEGIHRVVVLDGDEICGLVSSLDILRWLARSERYAIPEREGE